MIDINKRMKWKDPWKINKITNRAYRDGTMAIKRIIPTLKNGKTVGREIELLEGPILFNVKNIRTQDETWAYDNEQTIDLKIVIPGIHTFITRPSENDIVIQIEENIYRIIRKDESKEKNETFLYLQFRSGIGGVK